MASPRGTFWFRKRKSEGVKQCVICTVKFTVTFNIGQRSERSEIRILLASHWNLGDLDYITLPVSFG